MRKPTIEKFDFTNVDADSLDKAIGVSQETAQSVMNEVGEVLGSSEKYSTFVQKLDEDFSKAEIILALLAVLKH